MCIRDRLDRLLREQPPQLVIFVVDYWAFCTGKEEFPPFKRPRGTFHDGQGNPNKSTLLWRLLIEGQLSLAELGKVLKRAISSETRALPRIGISSLISDSGFGADGSMYNFVTRGSVDPAPEPSKRSHISIEALRRGEGRLPKYCRLSAEGIALIAMLGAELAGQGIDLVVIAPPVSGALFDAMELSLIHI